MQQTTIMELANTVFATVIRNTKHQRDDMSRYTLQEAFRGVAIELGVENRTPDMRFVVTKCMAMAGYGS